MEVIPVIDLKNGTVVRARMGQRDRYLPIETPLSRSSDPVDVTRGLLSIFPFRTLYVADLDAIGGAGDNGPVLGRLRNDFPGLQLWVDNGIADIGAALKWLSFGYGQLVLGSESQNDGLIFDRLSGADVVLSLDFRASVFLGPAVLLSCSQSWPQRVIVMTLSRVGSGLGPDLERLASVIAAAPDKHVYAAGGIRDARDVAALKRAGAAGALVATCLHDGRLSRRDIEFL